jgi:hypothetical protein
VHGSRLSRAFTLSAALTRTLHLAEEFWTLRGGLSLRYDTGAVDCEACGGFSRVCPTWSVYRDERSVATLLLAIALAAYHMDRMSDAIRR